LFCYLKCDLSWREFQALLRRMYIVLLKDVILCRCLSGPFDLWYHSISEFQFFVWMTYLLEIEEHWCFLPLLCWGIYFFKSNSVCLMKLGAPTLGKYKLIIVISFWCIAPFMSMKSLFLSLLTNLGLMSTLFNISIGTPACFQGY
jgi:hypothetical protein